ncbi:hypothetical protein JA1_004240 [Spathaspora sp. JA1]|nr:hypothetical protein JA1_004240 [Spathaspora sp. JA1]
MTDTISPFISRQLFHCEHVTLYRIQPHNWHDIYHWDLYDKQKIWSGHMRFIEQDAKEEKPNKGVTVEKVGDVTTYTISQFGNLRSKLEFYNLSSQTGRDDIWAETWYNPLLDIQYDNDMKLSDTSTMKLTKLHSIAHDKQDTIMPVDNSDRFFRIVLQLPGTGYHPCLEGQEYDKELVQVAVGLEIPAIKEGQRFNECLDIYNSRYEYVQHRYYYDGMIAAIKAWSASEPEPNMKQGSTEGEPEEPTESKETVTSSPSEEKFQEEQDNYYDSDLAEAGHIDNT